MRRMILVSILVVTLLSYLMPVSSMAQEFTANVWASWVSAGNSIVTFTFPYKSRSITIVNGGSKALCASFDDNTITNACLSTGNNTVFQIPASQITPFSLLNLTKAKINFRSMDPTTASSPVTVIIAY